MWLGWVPGYQRPQGKGRACKQRSVSHTINIVYNMYSCNGRVLNSVRMSNKRLCSKQCCDERRLFLALAGRSPAALAALPKTGRESSEQDAKRAPHRAVVRRIVYICAMTFPGYCVRNVEVIRETNSCNPGRLEYFKMRLKEPNDLYCFSLNLKGSPEPW